MVKWGARPQEENEERQHTQSVVIDTFFKEAEVCRKGQDITEGWWLWLSYEYEEDIA